MARAFPTFFWIRQDRIQKQISEKTAGIEFNNRGSADQLQET